MSDRTPHYGPTSWRPGQSGNPGGRSRDRDATRLAKRYTVDAIRALVEVVRLPAHSHAAAKRAAARDLIDIAYPGLSKDGQTADGNALHMHLLAVQTGEQGEAAPSPEVEAERAHDEEQFSYDLTRLPAPKDDLPDEALPLWDAFKARKRAQEAEIIGEAEEIRPIARDLGEIVPADAPNPLEQPQNGDKSHD